MKTGKERLIDLAKQDLANARDNLYRARSAAQRCDPTQQWGQSGETLDQIIAGYKQWEKAALEAIAAAEK